MRTEHLIIGAGIAGIALRRTLGDRAVVLDPNPASYKIGESIIPEQFFHPSMRELLPDVRRLPSYSPKLGSTFIGDGHVACFPLEQHHMLTMHIYRPELEAMMLERFGIEVKRERVLEVDPVRRIVRTDQQVWESDGPILDCSGPAMVVANAIGTVQDLWPVHAVWAYYDVTEADDERFWRMAHERGWSAVALDQPTGRLIDDPAVSRFSTTRSTTLIQVRPGTWMWQIPLWDRRRLSVGVVSRGEPSTVEEFRAIVQEHGSSAYTLRERAESGPDPLDRVHRRSGFARKASVAATKDFILLGDAYAFADPIYSVGTGLAMNKAILVGEHLLRSGWTAEDARSYSEDYESLMETAIRAFNFWYSGEVMRVDAPAMEVQMGFLVGGAFHEGVRLAYRAVGADATALATDVMTVQVGGLIGAPAGFGEWRLAAAELSDHLALTTSWRGAGGKVAVVLVHGPTATRPGFRRVGAVAVSYGVGEGLATPATDPEALALIEAVTVQMKEKTEEWERLIQL